MDRLRHRPDYFIYRGDRMAFHRFQDGATLARLDPYAPGEQVWPLHSRRTISVTAEEIRDITYQVHGLELPSVRPPSGDWDEARIQAVEARLAALEARSVSDAALPPEPAPSADSAIDEETAVDPEKESLRDQVSELQRQLAERDAEPPPLSPDPVKHMIPEEIRKLMEDGESLSNAKRRLTELLWVEQAELRNLRGTDRGDLKREAEIERLLGLFARLGEI